VNGQELPAGQSTVMKGELVTISRLSTAHVAIKLGAPRAKLAPSSQRPLRCLTIFPRAALMERNLHRFRMRPDARCPQRCCRAGSNMTAFVIQFGPNDKRERANALIAKGQRSPCRAVLSIAWYIVAAAADGRSESDVSRRH